MTRRSGAPTIPEFEERGLGPDEVGKELEAAWERMRDTDHRVAAPAVMTVGPEPDELQTPTRTAAPDGVEASGAELADIGARIVRQVELRLEAQREEHDKELRELAARIDALTLELHSAVGSLNSALLELRAAESHTDVAADGATAGEVLALRQRVEDLRQLILD